jgi:hypothetical protein
MPDMSTYAQGKKGVALVVGPDSTWHAGLAADLHDLDAVEALARRRGRPAAAFPPAIANGLPGYNDRHAMTPGAGGGAAVIALDPARRHAAGTGPSPVSRLSGLAGDVTASLDGMPAAPSRPTSLADLIAARDAVNAAETSDPAANRAITLPDRITAPVLALLEDRGDAGARLGEVAAELGRPENTVKRYMRIMRDHGLIASAGTTRAGRYYLPEHSPDGEPAQDEPDDADDAA